MHSSLISTLCLLAAPLITAQTSDFFTAPTPGTVLNFSAETIDVQWNPSNVQYTQLDLKFTGPTFSYTLAENISIQDGSYTWDPQGERSALASEMTELPSDEEVFYFEAAQHNANSSSGAEVRSGNYALEGYRFMSAAGGLQLQAGAAVLGALSLLVAFVV